MAQPYLDQLRTLVERISARHGDGGEIACKHFFSGAAAYVEGRIFMTSTPAGLALKLAPDDRDALLAAGGQALRYFPKAPIKKDYVVLPAELAGDDTALAPWIAKSLAHARK